MTRSTYRAGVEVGVLGPVVVRRDGEELPVPGGKERLLLARLAASARRTVPVEELVLALWGEEPPPSAAKSLQTHVLRLRNLLEPSRDGAPRLLLTDPAGYRLALPAEAVDAERFGALCADAQRLRTEDRPADALELLDDALALWRGPAYAGLAAPDAAGAFPAADARRLEELRLTAAEERCEALLVLHREREAVPELERLLAAEPYRERLWELLVRALYASGRQADALGAYERARAALSEELGLDPGTALRELHRRVLAQDPSLEAGVLDDEQLRAVVAGYVPPGDVDSATAAVARESGGRPGRVHELARQWARRAAGARVAAAAEEAADSAGRLTVAREALAEGVLTLVDEPSDGSAPLSPVCPWRGLEAYDTADAPWYAGRERLVAELVSRLATRRLVAVVGASGSGKSSLVRAGLLPALAADVLPGSAGWSPVVLRPGAHPMSALARAAFAGPAAPGDVGALLERLLRGGGDAAVATLVVVDQAEELWTACDSVDERHAFLDLLSELVTDPRSSVAVVLVLRGDHLGDLAEAPALAAAAGDGTVLVGGLSEAELHRAVEVPARRAGLVLETGLGDALVADAGRAPGALPLVSTCLVRLWESRDGRRLTLSAYVSGGGLAGAVAGVAEDVVGALPAADLDAVRVLLLRLAGPGRGDGDGAPDRRRVPLEELRSLPDPRVAAVVEPLADARLLTVSDGHVEVAHEALFREWPRLRGWLAEDAAGQAVLRRLTGAAGSWHAEGRDPGLLWSGTRLAAAVDQAAAHPGRITPVEADFLAAATSRLDAERREAEDRASRAVRQNRRLRGLLGGLAGLLVVALVAGTVAVRARDRAEDATTQAEAGRLAAVAVGEDLLDRGLLQAVEAVQTAPGPETDGALLSLLARAPEAVTQVRTPNRWLRGTTTPDGETVVLVENEPRVRAVDAEDGRTRWEAELPEQATAVAATQDVVVVTLPSEQEDVVGLSAGDGRVLWSVDARSAPGPGAGLVARRTDGSVVVVTAADVVVLDPATGGVRGRVPVQLPGFPVAVVPLGPDRVAVGTEGQPALLVDLRTRRTSSLPVPGVPLPPSPDGRTVPFAESVPDRPATLVLRAAGDWRALAPPLPVEEPTSGSWSPDGRRFAVGDGQVVRVLDGGTGGEQTVLRAHSGLVHTALWTPDHLWSVGRDGTAIAWDPSGARGLLRRGEAEGASSAAAVAPDGARAVALRVRFDGPDEALVVDPATGRRLAALAPPAQCLCQALATGLTDDGGTAVVSYQQFPGPPTGPPTGPPVEDEGRLVAYDAASGRVLREVLLPWPAKGVDDVPGSRRVVVSSPGAWGVVDLDTGRVEPAPALRVDEEVRAVDPGRGVAVSPDGRRVALDQPGALVLADLASLREVRRTTLPDEDAAWVAAWTPDGGTLLTGGPRGVLRFLSPGLRPTAPARVVTPGWFTDIEPSPDGRLIASVGTDGDVLLWDARSRQPLGRPVSDEHGHGWASFTPDGTRLRTVHEDGTRLDVPVERAAWVELACRVAGRSLTEQEWAVSRPGVAYRPACR